MKIMRKLYDQCMEELNGTIEYSNCATSCHDNPDLSKMYLNMAKQELEHAQTLHNMSKKLAESKIGENIDPMLMELWEEMEQSKINKMANQNQCCCETKMLIQENAAQQRYESAMQNNAVIQAIQAEGAATREMYQQDKIEALQNRVNQLQLDQAMQGVVRYPNMFAYNTGNNPFCGCGNGYCNNI